MQITSKTPTRNPAAATALALWEEYHRTGELAARDRIVFTFSPMVSHIVEHQLAAEPAQADPQRLFSCGLQALIDAVESYDLEQDATLEHFAWRRVHAAVLLDADSRRLAPALARPPALLPRTA